MRLDDPRLMAVEAMWLANSLASNTVKAYEYRFAHFVGFCERAEVSSWLSGEDPVADEDALVGFCLYEFEVQGNKHSTTAAKLSAIRWHTMERGYPNPLEGKHVLKRLLAGMKRLRGRVEPKGPLPMEVIVHLYRAVMKRGRLHLKGAVLAIVVAFFFLLRVSEFAAQDSHHMEKFILLRSSVTFRKNTHVCEWYEKPDEVELFIRGSKTDQEMQGCVRCHFKSGSELCPVDALVQWFSLTEGSKIPASAPLFSVPVGKTGSWSVITRADVSDLIKRAAVDCGIPKSLIGTHSIRISGATHLLLCGCHPLVVQIIGRWRSQCFLRYQRYWSELMHGVPAHMAGSKFDIS